jgi:hypothetical protein
LSSEGPVFESKECISAISKRMYCGQIRRIGAPRIDAYDSPRCRSFKARHNITCLLKTNKDCDSGIAEILNGRLTSTITHGLIFNGEGRRAHHGNCLARLLRQQVSELKIKNNTDSDDTIVRIVVGRKAAAG